MRRTVSVLLLAAVIAIPVSAAATPEALFDLGMRAYRAQDYASAVVDLNEASRAFDPQTGPAFQTTLAYLALAQFRLGMEEASRDTILRLVESERVSPAYTSVTLGSDTGDFDALVAALVPNANLQRVTLEPVTPAADDPTVALPSVRPAAPAIEATTEVRAEEIQEETERRIAAIEAEADRRIAEIQAEADRRIAAAQAEADRRVAAAQAAADARVAAAETASRERIAEAERLPVPSEPPASQPAVAVETRRAETPALRIETLRQAESFATAGDVQSARELYARAATDPNASREVIAAAGTGLYRTGAYREAATAFRRLGVFARGEEDLRYYFAIALYESGDYREAQRELACALPFITRTEDVERYRLKIDQTMAVNLR